MARDDRIVIKADARCIGAVTALSVGRYSERWKGSGTKSGECVSIFPDGTKLPFTRTRTTNPSTRLLAVKTAKVDHAQTYADRLRTFGAIGNGDND